MGTINKLNVLDFSPGIRAVYINENFDLVRRWIEEERIRTSGWGIAEGFELSEGDLKYTIHVSDGIFINKQGEYLEEDGTKVYSEGKQVTIEGETFDGYDLDEKYGLKPNPDNHRAYEQLTVTTNGDYGSITLEHDVYNRDNVCVVYYSGSATDIDEFPSTNDLKITCEGDILDESSIAAIQGNEITLAKSLIGKDVTIEYSWSGGDRIDGIFIRQDGDEYDDGSMFRYYKGTSSATPTCQEYEYVIGYVYWHCDKTFEPEFILSDRSYRNVYVDSEGTLYLNGKEYTGDKFVLFAYQENNDDSTYEKSSVVQYNNYPKGNPVSVENDLWYDKTENVLKIYRQGDDDEDFDWYPVNDISRYTREVKLYQESANPEDLQTFNFEESGDENLFFVPGKNQLSIVIDQVVLMKDQFEELVKDASGNVIEYSSLTDDEKELYSSNASGIGFKLVEPLDQNRIIEVSVAHSVNTYKYTKDLFDKVACFVKTTRYKISKDVAITGLTVTTESTSTKNNYNIKVAAGSVKVSDENEIAIAAFSFNNRTTGLNAGRKDAIYLRMDGSKNTDTTAEHDYLRYVKGSNAIDVPQGKQDEHLIATITWSVNDGSVIGTIDQSTKETYLYNYSKPYWLTDAEFETSSEQLELWQNGVKLVYGEDFVECYRDDDVLDATSSDVKVGVGFNFTDSGKQKLVAGDIIEAKITRFMSSYSNFNDVVYRYEEALEYVQDSIDSYVESHNALYSSLKTDYDAVKADLISRVENLEKYKRDSTISDTAKNGTTVDDVAVTLSNKLITEQEMTTTLRSQIKHERLSLPVMEVGNSQPIDGTIDDILIITYVNDNTRIPLIRELDYQVEEIEAADGSVSLQINIINDSLSSDGKLYIEQVRNYIPSGE